MAAADRGKNELDEDQAVAVAARVEAEILAELSAAEIERVRAIRQLLSVADPVEYERVQERVARQLGLSVSSVKR